MTNKRILSLVLALLMVLTTLPFALAETEPAVVYAYSAGGVDFYACDETGTEISGTLVDPNTVTHLYLAPKPGYSDLYPLLMEDQTTLQWVTVVDPDNYGLYLNRDLFTGYVNLKELHLPEAISGASLEIVENTSLRSFTLPKGSIDASFFQKCYTIEEIVNPTDSDVTLSVRYEDITVPAGSTWKSEFSVSKYLYYNSTPGADVSISLPAVGADGVNPVTWAVTEGYSLPEGYTLTEDGLLTGKYPAEHNSTEWVYVTATNGEQTADSCVFLAAYDPIDVTVNLPEGVTLVSGPAGEKSMNTYALNTWTFADEFEDKQLRDVRLTATYSNGDSYLLSSNSYTLRGNTLLLAAEKLISLKKLTVEPLYVKDDLDAIETATPLTFPYEETVEDSSYVYMTTKNRAYDTVVYKVDLKLGQKVDFTWAHPEDEEVDTQLIVFTKVGDALNEVSYCDNDNVGVYGESGSLLATEDVTYYIFASTRSSHTAVGCTFTATLSEAPLPKDAHLTEPLNFTDPDALPEPDEDGCWTWDAATKTLTLKDGFTMFVADGEAINLPADTTLKVDGKATVASRNDAISGKNNLTVELGPKADLTLISIWNEAIDLDKGLLKINGQGTSKLTTLAYSDDNIVAGDYAGEEYDEETDSYIPLIDNGEVHIKDTILVIECDNDAIEVLEGSITLDGCKVTINAGSDGFLCDWYDGEKSDHAITLTDCTVNATCGDSAFDACTGSVVLKNSYVNVSGYCVFKVWDTITVEGGRLVVRAIEDSPVARFYAPEIVTEDTTEAVPTYFTVNNATFYLSGTSITNASEISLPGELYIEDDKGNLLYTGVWDIEAIRKAIDPETGSYPALIASVIDPGDVNMDGDINALDALMVLQFAVGKLEISEQQQTVANVSGDQTINAVDALMILQYAVDKINIFPVEK